MAELKCGVENCTYNNEHYCCKGDIMVGGTHACDCQETCCESFRAQGAAGNTAKNATEHPSRTISIDCEAVRCMYNTNYKCYADHVDIRGNGANDCKETACATFTERAVTR